MANAARQDAEAAKLMANSRTPDSEAGKFSFSYRISIIEFV